MDYILNKDLLEDKSYEGQDDMTLNACINAHGLFDSFQFVLRLSPEVHRKIRDIPQGIISANSVSFEQMQAYSTYLHETIHWWQHIGSTAGFIQSLVYPSQVYMSLTELNQFLEKVGPVKSINKWIQDNPRFHCDETLSITNTIINNFYDSEFFRLLMRTPEQTKRILESPFFECQGHSFTVMYTHMLSLFNRTVDLDDDNELFNGDHIFELYQLNKRNNVPGYNYQSRVEIPPIGSNAIYEGQARFSQMQFLAGLSGFQLKMSDFGQNGMLDGIYVEAFNFFMKTLSVKDFPSELNDKLVNLFLLVCDLAINPGAGFPLKLQEGRNIVKDADPGIRFTYISKVISYDTNYYLSLLKNLDRQEYFDVTTELCNQLGYDTPETILKTISNWKDLSSKIQDLLNEKKTYDYKILNYPIRVLFSHFISFSEDKLKYPEFFCWPGIHKTGIDLKEYVADLHNRNQAIFIDRPDKDGIYAAIIPGIPEDKINKMLGNFYSSNVIFNFTRQWIINSGDFIYENRWLSSKGTIQDYKDFVNRHFKQLFNASLDQFKII